MWSGFFLNSFLNAEWKKTSEIDKLNNSEPLSKPIQRKSFWYQIVKKKVWDTSLIYIFSFIQEILFASWYENKFQEVAFPLNFKEREK